MTQTKAHNTMQGHTPAHNLAHNIADTAPDIAVPQASAEQHILPADTSLAIKALIQTTEKLIDISEREAQCIAKNDMVGFTILQDEKNIQSERYVRLAQEFRARLNDFRNADKVQLERLDTLQKTLGENTQHNNRLIHQIQKKASARTENSLLSAQEIGQSYQVTFPEAQSAS